MVFGKPEHARGVLRSAVPAALADALDWSTLTLQPGNFFDRILQPQYTDLVYRAAWRDGGEALYLLFEHQSAPTKDGLMIYRLLRYQVRIWEEWHASHPNAKALPTIIPVVMYHGVEAWSDARLFGAVLDMPVGVRPAVAPYLVELTYLLNDLSTCSDEELRESAMLTALAKLTAICFKHARARADFLQIFARWMDVVREVARAPNGLEALGHVLCYILEVSELVEEAALHALLEREIGPETKDVIVTLAQQYRQEGRQQGVQEGTQRVLLRQLRRRFGGDVDARVEQRVAAASVEQIEVWADRVLSAATLTELLAD